MSCNNLGGHNVLMQTFKLKKTITFTNIWLIIYHSAKPVTTAFSTSMYCEPIKFSENSVVFTC